VTTTSAYHGQYKKDARGFHGVDLTSFSDRPDRMRAGERARKVSGEEAAGKWISSINDDTGDPANARGCFAQA
jgi:hypothetical protein